MAIQGTSKSLVPSLLGAAALSLGVAGCPPHEYVMIQTGIFPKPFIYHNTLQWTREGSASINTLHDYEIARGIAMSGLGQLEGLHHLVGEDKNGLHMLNRAWAGVAFGFMDDDREEALERKDEVMAEYHASRARAACKRARYYGEQLVREREDGYDAALKNAQTLQAWLIENYTDSDLAEELYWLGFSIVGTVSFDRENPAAVAELWVGVEILNHVVRLDETVERGMAHTVLGAYHARSAMAELDEAKKHFDRALQIQGGKVLNTQVSMAQTYYCMKRDKQSYTKTLEAVL